MADLADRDLILLAPPAQHMRRILEQLKEHVPAEIPLLICAKGLEQESGKLLGDVVTSIMPNAVFGALSGPSFAGEVARSLPTALTVACKEEALGKRIAKALGSRQSQTCTGATT